MVGVPGRSKGCRTCLKRKVKCDEKRPHCDRCAKAGYLCRGYERTLQIRTHSFTNNGVESKMLTSKPIRTKSNPFLHPLVLHIHPNSGHIATLGSQAIPSSLSLVAFKDNLEFSYLFDNFVWRTYAWPWLELSARGKLGLLSLDASRCVAQTVFGKSHHQKDIELQGQVLYGQAIRGLSQELCNAGKPGCEELIVPILLLLIHASTTMDRQASLFHVTGLSKIIQSCEPTKFGTLPLRSAFESARTTLFTISLLHNKRYFLAEPAWKVGPWSNANSPPKSPQNNLVDIIINLPGYLEDISEIERGTAPEGKTASLLNHLKSDLTALYQWRWSWDTENPNATWEIEPTNLPPGFVVCDSRALHDVLWFRTFSQAAEISLYNAVLICTLGLLWQFEPQEGRQAKLTSTGLLTLPGQYNSLYEPAQEICRAFEYQLLNASKSRESALFWLLPLGIAHKVLQNDAQFGPWIQSLLDRSSVTRGYGTGKMEFAFGHYDFLDAALEKHGSG